MSFINTRNVIGDQATLDGLVANTLTELNEDGVNTLRQCALYYNSGLISVAFPGISNTTCGSSTFYRCTYLTTAAFPNMTYFANYMFEACTSLVDISAPAATGGSNACLMSCYALESVNFPMVTRLNANVFDACRLLSSVSFSTSFSVIGVSAFRGCVKLQSISFPNVNNISASAFYACYKLSTVSLPNLKILSDCAFTSCPIKKLVLPMVSRMGFSVTDYAWEVDIGTQVSFNTQTFYNDANLFSLLLRSSSMTSLPSANVFMNTPIQYGYGKIYVPNDLVSAYRSATNWVTFASQIDSIDNYTDGPPVGGITDTWAEIFAAEQDGTYLSKYSVGDLKWLEGEDTYYLMQIIAFDTDTLADNSGNAHITWFCKGYYGLAQMNSSNRSGGWLTSDMRAYLRESIFPSLDQTVRSAIKEVSKTYKDSDDSTNSCADTIWIPSYREVLGSTASEKSGCVYTGFFTSDQSRIKYSRFMVDSTGSKWWLRSGIDTDRFYCVTANGTVGGSGEFNSNTLGVVFGFCT